MGSKFFWVKYLGSKMGNKFFLREIFLGGNFG